MSLRILVQPDQVNNWITTRQGTPARKRGTDADPCILFDKVNDAYEPLSVDELLEAMKSHHLVLLVEEEPGQTYHKFVVRG